jgi:hypothetical protein
MEKKQTKMGGSIYAIFNGKTPEILRRYTPWKYFCFEHLTNQHCNRQLKDIASLAKLKIK